MINTREGVVNVFMRVMTYIIVFLGLMGLGEFIGNFAAKGIQVFFFVNPTIPSLIIEFIIVAYGMIYFVRHSRK